MGHFLCQEIEGLAGGIFLLLEDVLSLRVWEVCFSLRVGRGEKHMQDGDCCSALDVTFSA